MKTISILLSNRYASVIGECPERLRHAFAFHPPNYFFMTKYKMGVWDGWLQKMTSRGVVSTGLFRALGKNISEQLKIRFVIERQLTETIFKTIPLSDRPYQNDCLFAMQKAAQLGGGIVIAATGSGKTKTAGMFLKSLVGEAVFVVDELTLLEQSRREISKELAEPVGKIGESEFSPQRITVATAQSLFIHRARKDYKKWMRRQQVVIVDELHTAINRRTFTFLESLNAPVIFGLTATLQTELEHIKMTAYSLAGPVIFRFPLETATKEKYLTKGIVVQLQLRTTIKEATAWSEEQEKFIRAPIEEYRELAGNKLRNEVIKNLTTAAVRNGRRVVILVEWVNHIKRLSRLLPADIEYRSVHGAIGVKDRQKAITDFENGKVSVIVANRVFSKGIDIRSVDFIIDGTAGKSANSAVQRYGRGVRLYKGKTNLIYVDIADEGNRFKTASKARFKAFRKAQIQIQRIPYRSGMDLDRLITVATRLAIGRRTNETSITIPRTESSKSS